MMFVHSIRYYLLLGKVMDVNDRIIRNPRNNTLEINREKLLNQISKS